MERQPRPGAAAVRQEHDRRGGDLGGRAAAQSSHAAGGGPHRRDPDPNQRRPLAQGDDRLFGQHAGRRNQFAVFAALAIALAPAVLLAALNPRFSAAPFTAVMVFFGPTITHTGPIAAAFERVIEVAVGCVVGLVVALVVLPARAHDLAVQAATQMPELLA